MLVWSIILVMKLTRQNIEYWTEHFLFLQMNCWFILLFCTLIYSKYFLNLTWLLFSRTECWNLEWVKGQEKGFGVPCARKRLLVKMSTDRPKRNIIKKKYVSEMSFLFVHIAYKKNAPSELANVIRMFANPFQKKKRYKLKFRFFFYKNWTK